MFPYRTLLSVKAQLRDALRFEEQTLRSEILRIDEQIAELLESLENSNDCLPNPAYIGYVESVIKESRKNSDELERKLRKIVANITDMTIEIRALERLRDLYEEEEKKKRQKKRWQELNDLSLAKVRRNTEGENKWHGSRSSF